MPWPTHLATYMAGVPQSMLVCPSSGETYYVPSTKAQPGETKTDTHSTLRHLTMRRQDADS